MKPPALVNFREFPSRFSKIWLMRSLSQRTLGCSMPSAFTVRYNWRALASAWIMLYRSSNSTVRLQGCSSRATLPLSMRLMSKMSLMRLSRWVEEDWILPRYSRTFSGWSMRLPARAVKPTMAFMGVRMSWDIFDKKALLAALALLARSRASSSSARRFISSRVCISTLRKPSTIL